MLVLDAWQQGDIEIYMLDFFKDGGVRLVFSYF